MVHEDSVVKENNFTKKKIKEKEQETAPPSKEENSEPFGLWKNCQRIWGYFGDGAWDLAEDFKPTMYELKILAQHYADEKERIDYFNIIPDRSFFLSSINHSNFLLLGKLD